MILDNQYGEELTIGVEQLKLYNDGEEQVDVVTSQEAEAGEDTELEKNIENAE
jgi:hypothetical protein